MASLRRFFPARTAPSWNVAERRRATTVHPDDGEEAFKAVDKNSDTKLKPIDDLPGPTTLKTLTTTIFKRKAFRNIEKFRWAYLQKFGQLYQENYGAIKIIHSYDPALFAQCSHQDGKRPFRPVLPLMDWANKKDNYVLGLGSKNGEEWERQRRILKEVMLSFDAVERIFIPWINIVTKDLIRSIKEDLRENRIIDFNTLLTRYTMEAVTAVSLGERVNLINRKVQDPEGEILLGCAIAMLESVARTQWSTPLYRIFKTPSYKKFIDAYKEISLILRQRIRFPDHSATRASSPTSLKQELMGRGVNALEIESIVGDFFTAGIVSTSSALSFLLYNLATNPQSQHRLREEITKENFSEDITRRDLARLPFLSACIKESFRLFYPVAGGTFRILSEPISYKGYWIPKSTGIFFNNQVMCKMEEYVPRPNEYLPERWLSTRHSENKADNAAANSTTRQAEHSSLRPPPYVVLPFGHGPRACVGKRFVESMLSLAVVSIVKDFSIDYAEGKSLGIESKIFTVPDRNLELLVKLREWPL